MIRYFRESVQGNFAKVFIVLICIPFVLVGVDSFFNNTADKNLAKVNGEQITEVQVNNETQRLLQQIRNQQGDAFDPSSFDEATIRPSALQNLIKQELLTQAANNTGLAISPAMINKIIIEQSIFHEDGQFSKDRYQNLLRSNNLSSNYYKGLVQNDALLAQLNSAYAGSQFVSAKEIEQRVAIEYETRDVAYLIFDAKKEAATIITSDDAIAAYYDDNQANFMTEQTVAVNYIEIKIEDYFDVISEEDIIDAYEQQVANMSIPAQRKAAHILIEFDGKQAKAAANDLLLQAKERIAQGEDFAALAKELSSDQGSADNGGELGYSSGELFPEAFEQTLAALDINQVSDVVETDSGLHLIKLLDVQSTELPSLDQLRAGIALELQRLDAEDRFIDVYEEVKDLAFDSDSIESVASSVNLSVLSSGHFPEAGANSGLFTRAGLVQQAFSSELLIDRRISDLTELGNDHFIVMQVHAHEPAQQQSLDDVLTVVSGAVKTQLLRAALNEKTTAVISAVDEGLSLADAATQHDLTPISAEAVSRRDLKGLDAGLVGAAFSRSTDKAFQHEQQDGSYTVILSSNVAAGSPESLEPQIVDNLKRMYTRLLARAESVAFDGALRSQADISSL